jgi:ribosomal-protein-alanine N-acetyltransferase
MSRPPKTSNRIEVRTPRLRLVAIDTELARLQVEDRPAFFAALGAQEEAAWPPVADDDPKLADKLELLTKHPEQAGWRGWVFLMGWTPGGLDRAVGVGGFFGPPDETGEIEIGYAMCPSFREQGLATEAVGGMLDWAFEDARVRTVRALTQAHLYASRRVLEKSGFSETETVTDGEESIRYDLAREDRAA